MNYFFPREPCDSAAMMYKGLFYQKVIDFYYSLIQDVDWPHAFSHGSLCSRSVKIMKRLEIFLHYSSFFLFIFLTPHETIINTNAIAHLLLFCLFLFCWLLVLLYFFLIRLISTTFYSPSVVYFSGFSFFFCVVRQYWFSILNHAHESRASP